MHRSRNRWGAAVAVLSLLIGLAACGSDDAPPVSSSSTVSATTTSTTSRTTTTKSTETTTETPPPPPAPPPVNALTGLEFSPNFVVAAKIDNTFSGSQWGVGAADVVVVEMVEGELSRLIAIFYTTIPGEIGPIRSVRTTDPDLLVGYGTPALMFSGGAGGPMDNFAASGLIDASPDVIGDAYWRSSAASEPYDLHGDAVKVVNTLAGISAPKNPGFTFITDDPRVGSSRPATTITASFANPISFTYNGDGTYRYIRRGSPQSDGATGLPLTTTNVLVQRTVAEPDGTVDSAGSPSFKSASTGGGTFTLYRDGKAIDGTWSRPDTTSPTSYLDNAGNAVPFKPGRTWIVLAPQQIPTGDS